MKNLFKKIGITVCAVLVASSAYAIEGPRPSNNQKNSNGSSTSNSNGVNLAANCTPSKKVIRLDYNNISTNIYSNGLLWLNRANGVSAYEAPKNSGTFALYSGGLWLGGTDVNGQLKAAVSTFGEGNDYWTGPLDTLGTAEISPDVCDRWDKFDTLRRSAVQEFVAYWEAKQSGNPADLEPFRGYEIPKSILNWPGNGDETKGQARKLAPFVDRAGGTPGVYDPENDGDYPFYDLLGNVDCRKQRKNRSESSSRPLFGDYTIWWIFNDKGNIHTQSNAPGIGMEIHAQAFAFATNDEINSMTFYNYELINRSTFTLTNTYFGNWVDPDLGASNNDFVGCDVNRGLGYCYNGTEIDDDFQGQQGYGANPPAIGLDYFEGPYQDADGINNNYGIGPNEALNGLGYFNPADQNPDTIKDNERFGMRRFVYYNIGRTIDNGDPTASAHYYNYLRGIWKNGQRMRHGGNGFNSSAVENVETDFMFPGDSDPLRWGTKGIAVQNTNWTEDNTGVGQPPNQPGDRRFLQSAGPFTLEPGNVNDITFGVVFARAESGGRLASVQKLFEADDKAQVLFDNCFKVLSGPDAPDITIQELDRELILYLSNPITSNNVNKNGEDETYKEKDPNIVTPDALAQQNIFYDDTFRFQGYIIYQLAAEDVSVGDLDDESKARIVAQVDVKDDVTQIVNFDFDEGINAQIPTVKVVGENKGIRHSFRVTTDLFASGDNRLINFKTYYFIAIAYGHNEYIKYAQNVPFDPNNPLAPSNIGQTKPYLGSRQNGLGGSIQSVAGIPHNPFSENGGTVVNSSYGDDLQITRLSGKGNGGQELRLTKETIKKIAKKPIGDVLDTLEYERGNGPAIIKIIDPLNVPEASYILHILGNVGSDSSMSKNSRWELYRDSSGIPVDTIKSEKAISIEYEQILPKLGISVNIKQVNAPGDANTNPDAGNGYLNSNITYDNPSLAWLDGIRDQDGYTFYNWILSGQIRAGDSDGPFLKFFDDKELLNTSSLEFADPDEDFEGILGGIWAPYTLTQWRKGNVTDGFVLNAPAYNQASVKDYNELRFLNSVSIVFTSDKSLWTRCPVVELQEEPSKSVGGVERHELRASPSIDKDGNFADPNAPASQDPNSPSFISSTGMGWFPGYAVNLETGERLNMAYGEDSWYGADNGSDMKWNPTSTVTDIQLPGTSSNLIWGGKHYVYVFRKTLRNEPLAFLYKYPAYDYGEKLYNSFKSSASSIVKNTAWGSCNYVGIPILKDGHKLLETDATVTIQVRRPYGKYTTGLEALVPNSWIRNGGKPVYKFNTNGLGSVTENKTAISNATDKINVVPNPYYANSEYEINQLDNRVKIINLPQVCDIKIYNLSGTLIREYAKNDPNSFLDWDLKNQANISISSGVYIIHVDVPGVGEKVIKWFGVLRPVDLNNF